MKDKSTDPTRELWEERFEIYCEQNFLDKRDLLCKAIRDAFKEGYEWAIADRILASEKKKSK